MRHTHLRLSAIFSNAPGCIQVNALALQKYVGVFTPHGLDCNTSYNAAKAIGLLVKASRDKSRRIAQVYYYTRPTVEAPAYGSYLVAYRKAHGAPGLWVPHLFMQLFIVVYHAVIGRCIPRVTHGRMGSALFDFLHAADYLLQVAYREHTFDNSLFRQRDFPEIVCNEESIVAGFRRIAIRQKT